MAYHTAYLVPFTEAIVNKIMDDKRIMYRRNNELLIESFPTIGFALFKFLKHQNFINNTHSNKLALDRRDNVSCGTMSHHEKLLQFHHQLLPAKN